MITLITGVPGSGKTSKAVADLAEIKDRPIFVMGIPDLQITHEIVPPVAEWTRQEPSPEDPAHLRPVFNFPPNSILVIDEAQNVYRPMAVGSKVPDHVSALETHRHTGIDIWLITQHPSLIHANVRRLVGKHYHVHVHPFGRKLLEWAGARDPSDKSDRADAVTTAYKPPKKAFSLYKSSELHTKAKASIPALAYIVPVLVFASAALSYQIYSRVAGKSDTAKAASVTQTAAAPASVAPAPVKAFTSDEFTPVDYRRPESAPIYAEVVQVKDFPQIQGCVKTETMCKCVTQQGTSPDLPTQTCLEWFSRRPFNPYRDPVQLADAGSVSYNKAVGAERPTLAAGVGQPSVHSN